MFGVRQLLGIVLAVAVVDTFGLILRQNDAFDPASGIGVQDASLLDPAALERLWSGMREVGPNCDRVVQFLRAVRVT